MSLLLAQFVAVALAMLSAPLIGCAVWNAGGMSLGAENAVLHWGLYAPLLSQAAYVASYVG